MNQPTPVVTAEQIEAGRSPRGGWTRETLASWGVPWPPPKGWRKRLIRGEPVMADKAIWHDIRCSYLLDDTHTTSEVQVALMEMLRELNNAGVISGWDLT